MVSYGRWYIHSRFILLSLFMPLDASMRFPEPKKLNLPLIPPDMYQVQLLDVEQKEFENRNTKIMEPKLSFKFAVLDEGESYGRFLYVTSAMSLNPKANFAKMFPAIVGRQPNEEEIKTPQNVFTGEFINSMIGVQLRASVSQIPIDEKDPLKGLKNKVETFLPAKVVMPAYSEEKAKQALVAKQG